jgi:hypothetical protein
LLPQLQVLPSPTLAEVEVALTREQQGQVEPEEAEQAVHRLWLEPQTQEAVAVASQSMGHHFSNGGR